MNSHVIPHELLLTKHTGHSTPHSTIWSIANHRYMGSNLSPNPCNNFMRWNSLPFGLMDPWIQEPAAANKVFGHQTHWLVNHSIFTWRGRNSNSSSRPVPSFSTAAMCALRHKVTLFFYLFLWPVEPARGIQYRSGRSSGSRPCEMGEEAGRRLSCNDSSWVRSNNELWI